MKALSIMQPWASMIVFGFKPVENRTWSTGHRGPTLIHAGKKVDKEAMDWLWQHEKALGLTRGWHLLPFRTGGIVGQANLYDVSTYIDNVMTVPAAAFDRFREAGMLRHDPRPWFFGPVGFWLRDARELPFRPLRGQLGFFEVPDEA